MPPSLLLPKIFITKITSVTSRTLVSMLQKLHKSSQRPQILKIFSHLRYLSYLSHISHLRYLSHCYYLKYWSIYLLQNLINYEHLLIHKVFSCNYVLWFLPILELTKTFPLSSLFGHPTLFIILEIQFWFHSTHWLQDVTTELIHNSYISPPESAVSY